MMEQQPAKKHPFSSYSTSELVRGATALKLSTETRIAMLDEIARRECDGDDRNTEARV